MQYSEPKPELTTEEILYTAPTDLGRRAAVAVLGVSVGNPAFAILFAVLTGATLVLGLLGALPFGHMWWLIPVVIAVFYIIFLLLTFRYLERMFSAQLPEGTMLAARFGPDHFWTRSPQGESTVRYDTYAHLWVRGGFVIFKLRRGGPATFLPIELIPDDTWLTHIRDRLAVDSRT